MAISMTVQGSSEYEVEEDKLYIYEIVSFDEDAMLDMFAYHYGNIEEFLGKDAEVGAMTARMITDVSSADDLGPSNDIDGWELDGWYWKTNTEGWQTDESKFEDPDSDEIIEFSAWPLYKDAKDYGTLIEFLWLDYFTIYTFMFTGVPTNVEDWLGDLDFESDVWDHDELTLTFEWDNGDYHPLYKSLADDLTESWTWTDKGEFQVYELVAGDIEIYQLRLKPGLFDSIPGYEMPLLLGIVGASAIGLIYLISKRNK